MELCKNCKAELNGPYCSRCGQKKFNLASLSLKPFLKNAFKNLRNFNFKLFADLPRLLVQPGMLTREFAQGRIHQHIKPATMFLWMNVFVLLAGYKVMFPQAGFYAANDYWSGLGPKIVEKAADRGIPLAEFIPVFSEHLAHYERFLYFCLVPIFAAGLSLLYFYRRDNYYVRHLVYSVHFWSYLFIYFAVVPLLLSVFNGGYRWLFGHYLIQSYEGVMFRALVLVGVLPYSWFALKKVYAENLWLTLIKTVLVFAIVIYLRRWGIGLTYYLTYLTI